MSEQAIQSVSINIGAVGTASRPVWRVPKDQSLFGGVTILHAFLTQGGAGTVVSQLTNLGTALGTAISSVIGTLTAGTLAANVQKEYSITTAYQAGGTWIGFNSVSGITDTVSILTLEFKWGK